MQRFARAGVRPETAITTLAEYGESVMRLGLRGLEPKTLDPYLAGWRRRIVPTLGHLAVSMVTNGAERTRVVELVLCPPDWSTLGSGHGELGVHHDSGGVVGSQQARQRLAGDTLRREPRDQFG